MVSRKTGNKYFDEYRIKKTGNEYSDVPLDCYDGTEVRQLAG